MTLNGDIETGFDVDDSSQATLRIQHDGASANRTKITAQELGATSFAAKLNLVQYGKWAGEDAVLLGFDFQFRFPNDSAKRFKAATIRVTLQETCGAELADPPVRKPLNDPRIVLIAPVQVCGELKKETKARYWSLRVPVKYQQFGAQAGVEGEFGAESEAEVERRMWITGYTDSDDHHHEDNAVVWEIKENEVQGSGILHRFPTALVACLPKNPKHPAKLSAQVTPTVAFSLNPLRLMQKRDDPIYLDRSSTKGQPIAPDLHFSDPKFPWDDIVKIPEEYSDQLIASDSTSTLVTPA